MTIKTAIVLGCFSLFVASPIVHAQESGDGTQAKAQAPAEEPSGLKGVFGGGLLVGAVVDGESTRTYHNPNRYYWDGEFNPEDSQVNSHTGAGGGLGGGLGATFHYRDPDSVVFTSGVGMIGMGILPLIGAVNGEILVGAATPELFESCALQAASALNLDATIAIDFNKEGEVDAGPGGVSVPSFYAVGRATGDTSVRGGVICGIGSSRTDYLSLSGKVAIPFELQGDGFALSKGGNATLAFRDTFTTLSVDHTDTGEREFLGGGVMFAYGHKDGLYLGVNTSATLRLDGDTTPAPLENAYQRPTENLGGFTSVVLVGGAL